MARDLLSYEVMDDRAKGYRGVLSLEAGDKSINGFSWVDVEVSGEGGNRRFSLSGRKDNPVRDAKSPAKDARYKLAVEYDSNPSIRDHWIAGVSFEVIDTTDGSSVATFRRYVMDPGQGDSTNGRSPWGAG